MKIIRQNSNFYTLQISIVDEKRPDLSNLTMNNQILRAKYVDGNITYKNQDPEFDRLNKEISSSMKPGIFLTRSDDADLLVRVRPRLNRHCILSSETFKDSEGRMYRDVDAKGVGYCLGYPIRVLPVRYPEMDGDEDRKSVV